MAEETDEFGIPIRKAATSQAEVDEFGIPVKKKEPTTKSPEVTTSVSQQPAEQPTKPLSESGASRNLLQEAQQLFGDQNKSEEQFQQGINPAAANYFERKRTERKEGVTTEEKLSVKNKDLTALRTEAAKNYYSLDKNSKYPAVDELKKLYTQANELAEQQKDNSGVIAKIEAIRNQPVDDSWRKPAKIQTSETGFYEIPNLIKSAYKNNGELYDATVDFYNKYEESDTKAKALYEQMKPEIEQLRVEETYKPTGTDEQGNEYMAQNPVKAFVENASQSMESLAITLKSLNPAYSKEEIIRDMDIKNLRDNVLFPQKAETALAKGFGMLGGVTPLVAGAFVSGGGLGAVAMNTLLFGAQGYGGKLYESYVTEKMNNPTMPDDEAYEIAKGNAKVAAGIQGALGATMPIQGGIGRKLFLNEAEKGAVKTFLAEQGVMVPAFGGATIVQNLIEGKEAKTGVVESMEDAFIIGAMLHTIGAGVKLAPKIRTAFENGIAKNYEKLSTVINDAVDAGELDFSTAQNLANRAKAFDVVGKENAPKVENELVDLGVELNDLLKEIDQRTTANPLSDVSDLEVRAKQVNRKILEKKGTPLTEKQRKEYEKILQKRDTVGKEGEKTELLPSEKEKLEHFEKRIEQGGKNEANKIAEQEGYDNATHLLNTIKKNGLGEFDKVQDVPRETLDKLKEKRADRESKKAELKYSIQQLENDIAARANDFISKGASVEEANKLAYDEFPKKDKLTLKKLKQELSDLEKTTTDGETTQTGVRPDETTATTETTAIEPTGETVAKETTVLREGETIADKKADIERRRQEEMYDNETTRLKHDIERSKDPKRLDWEKEQALDFIKNPVSYLKETIRIANENLKRNPDDNIFKSVIEDSQERLDVINKINAKYDAELAALEKPVAETTIEQPKIKTDEKKEQATTSRTLMSNEKFVQTGEEWTHLTNSEDAIQNILRDKRFIGRGEKIENFTKDVSNNRFNLSKENASAPYFQKGKFYGKPTQKYLIVVRGDEKFTPNINRTNAKNFIQSKGVGVLNPEYRDISNIEIYKRAEDGRYYKLNIEIDTPPKPVAEEIAVETIKPEVKDNFAKITDLFYKIREATGSSKKRSLKEQRDKILEENPSIKYIDDNISAVMKQLEDKGLITKKGDCP